MLKYSIKIDDKTIQGDLKTGEIKLIKLENTECQITISPEKNYDVGEGKGISVSKKIRIGEVGIILDGRGRPIRFNSDNDIVEWSNATGEFN